MSDYVYCIDTSSLIQLARQYPYDVFPTVWGKLAELIANDRLVAPREVLKEIELGRDELRDWARQHKKAFQQPDEEQLAAVKEVLVKFPALADYTKQTPEADAFVISLARVRNESSLFGEHIVVTEESPTNPNRIPRACAAFGIKSMSLMELFRTENWQF